MANLDCIGDGENVDEQSHKNEYSDSNSLERLSKLIDKTSDVFYLPGEPLPATNLVEHRISLIDDIPVNIRQYPIPQALQEFVREPINVLLQAGVIEPSESEYNSPLRMVPKADSPDGRRQYRMVTDYRKLNEKTVTMTYPIPNITHITEQLGRGNCFLVAVSTRSH